MDARLAVLPMQPHAAFTPENAPAFDASCSARAKAVIVIHGMGQQMPFDTLSEVAGFAATQLPGETPATIETGLCLGSWENRAFTFPRVRVRKDEGLLDLFEVYWAPYTEGNISYMETVFFLAKAGLSGLREAWKGHFFRWLYDGSKCFRVEHATPTLLLAALTLVTPLLLLAGAGGLIALLPPRWWPVTALLLGAFLLLRRAITQYLGDVAIYVSTNEVNRFWEVREQIREEAKRLFATVYLTRNEDAGDGETYAYDDVIVIGHSLGSVIAYDALNALFNLDIASGERLGAPARTAAFITLGSPLDKTAFLFGVRAADNDIRQALAGAVQPMLQHPWRFRPRAWKNIFNPGDAMAGRLDYYHTPAGEPAPAGERRVENIREEPWRFPPGAHTGYWRRAAFREIFGDALRAVCRLPGWEIGQ